MTRVVPIVIGCALLALLTSGCRGKDRLPESHIHLVLLYSAGPAFDPDSYMQACQERWNAKVVCADASELWPSADGRTSYMLTDGTHTARLAVSSEPLEDRLISMLQMGTPYLDERAAAELRDHVAYIVFDYLLGPDNGSERATFAAKALLTLARDLAVVGYVDTSAMLYQTRSQVDALLSATLTPDELFLLLGSVHTVGEGAGAWIHTHGMEQFGVPDLQIHLADASDQEYYRDVLINAAIYMIDRGPVLKPGDTAELVGDGVIYRILKAKRNRLHPFGEYGCLELVRQ
jgi:hypothetical protein